MTPEPRVIFEDADLLVVDKPGNLVCYGASRPGQRSLADWTREHGIATPRFLNRLDRETSGAMLVTKNERAAKILGKQMLRHEIEKEYVAICFGALESERGVIEQPIAVATGAPVYTKRVVDAAGKPCVTEFEVEQRLKDFTVVRLKPRTGRAHQLRVHMAWFGHPIVGDKVYGADERWYLEFIKNGVTEEMLRCLLMARQALHAAVLSARHPTTQEQLRWESPLPDDMRQFIMEHTN